MSRLDDIFPSVRPLQSTTELEQLQAAAAQDNHMVLGASHIVRLDEKIVGYFGIATVPLASFWAHSELMPRQTLHLVSVADALMASRTPTPYLTICASESPLRPLMEKLGYARLPTNLFVKEAGHGVR